MSTPPRPRRYTARIDNVYFLSRIGLSLRWATRSLPPQDVPANVRQLLAQLDEVEAEELAAHNAARRRAPDDAAG
jgi:hypothetical protein